MAPVAPALPCPLAWRRGPEPPPELGPDRRFDHLPGGFHVGAEELAFPGNPLVIEHPMNGGLDIGAIGHRPAPGNDEGRGNAGCGRQFGGPDCRVARRQPDLSQRPSRTWGSSRRAPERTAGPSLGDSEIPLKRPVGGRGPNLQHQMSASW
jgi:hypothetical protein